MSAGVMATTCPSCGLPVGADEAFCEECGTELHPGAAAAAPVAAAGLAGAGAVSPPQARVCDDAIGGVDSESVQFDAAAGRRRPPVAVVDVDLGGVPLTCASCSGPVASDGYCTECGTPAPRPRDHWVEQPASWVALACDRGQRHAVNQDGAAVAAAAVPGSFAALVVCDGVSSASRSEEASLAAARAARDALIAEPPKVPAPPVVPVVPAAVVEGAAAAASGVMAPESGGTEGGGTEGGGTGPVGEGAELPIGSSSVQSAASVLTTAMRAAGAAAQEQARAAASDPPEANPPACTFAAAVIEGPLLVAGCVGDSRVYWLPDSGTPLQVTRDDSLAGEAIAAGLPRADVERSPHAHSITRWLGIDAPDPDPRPVARRIEGPGWVLVCSDGLWNYCSEASAMRDLAHYAAREVGTDRLALAEALVAWANEQGGHDNIAVVVARLG